MLFILYIRSYTFYLEVTDLCWPGHLSKRYRIVICLIFFLLFHSIVFRMLCPVIVRWKQATLAFNMTGLCHVPNLRPFFLSIFGYGCGNEWAWSVRVRDMHVRGTHPEFPRREGSSLCCSGWSWCRLAFLSQNPAQRTAACLCRASWNLCLVRLQHAFTGECQKKIPRMYSLQNKARPVSALDNPLLKATQ